MYVNNVISIKLQDLTWRCSRIFTFKFHPAQKLCCMIWKDFGMGRPKYSQTQNTLFQNIYLEHAESQMMLFRFEVSSEGHTHSQDTVKTGISWRFLYISLIIMQSNVCYYIWSKQYTCIHAISWYIYIIYVILRAVAWRTNKYASTISMSLLVFFEWEVLRFRENSFGRLSSFDHKQFITKIYCEYILPHFLYLAMALEIHSSINR